MKARPSNVLPVVIVLVLMAATTVLAAAPGDPLRLGVSNTIQKVTRLTANLAGGVLKITNGGSGPALNLVVKPGSPPMAVNSDAKVTNLNADLIDGQHSSAFMGDIVTKRQSAVSTGTALGDGTRYIDEACHRGEILLSGGPANIDDGTVLLETFPITTNTWRVRIHNDSSLDSYSVVILCAARTSNPSHLDPAASANYGQVSLAPGFAPDPHSTAMTTGGVVDVSYLGSSCSGFATSAPDLKISWAGGGSLLRIYFIANAGAGDPRMVVNDPSANYYCVDDSFGTVNPTIDFNNPSAGTYAIWLGSGSDGTTISGTLFVTLSSANHP
jgi:hypothetical protein